MSELSQAVETMAECFTSIPDPEPFTALNCEEVEAIAAVLRAAGRAYAAEHILDLHAQGDDGGDAHYRPTATVSDAEACRERERVAGELGGTTIATEARDGSGIVVIAQTRRVSLFED